jgi:hypothetical protein
MLRPIARSVSPDLLDRPRPFPLLDRSFDAVELALARLGVADPAELHSPLEVEQELSATALPLGTLLVFDREEVEGAYVDIRDTVMDERLGGAVYGTMARPPTEDVRRRRLREMSGCSTVYGFLPVGAAPYGVGRVAQVRSPDALAGYEFLVADVPGFRVALVTRRRAEGGSITLWTGTAELVDEVLGVLRRAARQDGHAVQPTAPAVPARDAVRSEAEVWRQAAELREYRSVRDAELRQVARAAALRGVELRRERDTRGSGASHGPRGARAAS